MLRIFVNGKEDKLYVHSTRIICVLFFWKLNFYLFEMVTGNFITKKVNL